MGKSQIGTIVACLLLLFASTLFAENYTVINSRNGLDVLSGIYYANVVDEPVKFMPLSASVAVTSSKVGSGHDILLIQSRDVPTNAFLRGELEKSNTVEMLESTDQLDTNLKLAERSGTTKFIIVDPSFGQNALSVLPYAAKTNSYVIFAYSGNIDKVTAFLDTKAGRSVTIFGYVDSKTKEALSKYSPTYLGKGDDKYEDNVIMANEVLKLSPEDKMLFLCDGTYIEEGMVDGRYPIVFISSIVPTVTYNFIKENVKSGKIMSAILIGNNLITPAYDLRNRINNELKEEGSDKAFGVMVKFGQSVGGSTAQPLDTFPLPYYVIGLNIESVQYNKATNKLEVVVKSTAEGPEYFQNQVRIKVNGVEVQVLNDATPQLLERLEAKGSEYNYALPNIEEGNITADVIVRYGESAKSLSAYTFLSSPLTTVSFTDNSVIDFVSASYDSEKKILYISIRNNGTQDAYALVSTELNISGQKTTIKADGVTKVDKGSINAISIPIELSQQDLSANKEVKVSAQYGAREGFLQKTKEATLALSGKETGIDPLLIVLAILVVILLIVAIYFAMKRR